MVICFIYIAREEFKNKPPKKTPEKKEAKKNQQQQKKQQNQQQQQQKMGKRPFNQGPGNRPGSAPRSLLDSKPFGRQNMGPPRRAPAYEGPMMMGGYPSRGYEAAPMRGYDAPSRGGYDAPMRGGGGMDAQPRYLDSMPVERR